MNETSPITDLLDLEALIGPTTPVLAHRRDPLRTVLIVDALALFFMSGLWALWTHREWIREIDVALAILALCELVRLLLSRRD